MKLHCIINLSNMLVKIELKNLDLVALARVILAHSPIKSFRRNTSYRVTVTFVCGCND